MTEKLNKNVINWKTTQIVAGPRSLDIGEQLDKGERKTVKCVIADEYDDKKGQFCRGDNTTITPTTNKQEIREVTDNNKPWEHKTFGEDLSNTNTRLKKHLDWLKMKDEMLLKQRESLKRIAESKREQEMIRAEEKLKREQEKREKLKAWQESKEQEKMKREKEMKLMKQMEDEVKAAEKLIEQEEVLEEWLLMKKKQKLIEKQHKLLLKKKEEEGKAMRKLLARVSYEQWKKKNESKLLQIPKNGCQLFGPKPPVVVKEDWNSDTSTGSSPRRVKSNRQTRVSDDGFPFLETKQSRNTVLAPKSVQDVQSELEEFKKILSLNESIMSKDLQKPRKAQSLILRNRRSSSKPRKEPPTPPEDVKNLKAAKSCTTVVKYPTTIRTKKSYEADQVKCLPSLRLNQRMRSKSQDKINRPMANEEELVQCKRTKSFVTSGKMNTSVTPNVEMPLKKQPEGANVPVIKEPPIVQQKKEFTKTDRPPTNNKLGQKPMKGPVVVKQPIKATQGSENTDQTVKLLPKKEDSKSFVKKDDSSKLSVKKEDNSKSFAKKQDSSKSLVTKEDNSKSFAKKQDNSKSLVTKEDNAKSFAKKQDNSKSLVTKEDNSKSFAKRQDNSKSLVTKENSSKSLVKKEDNSMSFAKKEDSLKSLVKKEDSSKVLVPKEDSSKSLVPTDDSSKSLVKKEGNLGLGHELEKGNAIQVKSETAKKTEKNNVALTSMKQSSLMAVNSDEDIFNKPIPCVMSMSNLSKPPSTSSHTFYYKSKKGLKF